MYAAYYQNPAGPTLVVAIGTVLIVWCCWREVTFLEASRFAQENDLMFVETSALSGENVEEAFLKCARTILNKIETNELDPDKVGSGIQYGDSALRRAHRNAVPQPTPSATDSCCRGF